MSPRGSKWYWAEFAEAVMMTATMVTDAHYMGYDGDSQEWGPMKRRSWCYSYLISSDCVGPGYRQAYRLAAIAMARKLE